MIYVNVYAKTEIKDSMSVQRWNEFIQVLPLPFELGEVTMDSIDRHVKELFNPLVKKWQTVNWEINQGI